MSKMNFKFSEISLYAITLVSFISCTTKETITPIPINGSKNVFIAGFDYQSGASYWNNLTAKRLPFIEETSQTGATSIFVSNSNIYVAGYGTVSKGVNPKIFTKVAMYWKNGLPVSLTDGTYQAQANSIFVLGSDVYVAGYESNENVVVAKYWKNGVETVLSDTTKVGYANSIFVSGADVYVAGYENRGNRAYIATTNNGINSAMYWKNGVAINLSSDSTRNSIAQSIFVSGTDVYVAGNENNASNISVAKYWKNGVSIPLTDGIETGIANSIFVAGPDVYLTGAINSTPVYWKNGMAGIINTQGSGYAVATSVFVSGSDVYISGFQLDPSHHGNYVSYYWKNGVPFPITDGTSSAVASSIFVVE